MRHTAIAVLLAVVAAAPAFGAETPKGFSGEAELGFVATDGNTQTQNLNAKAKVEHEAVHWRSEAHAEAVFASDTGGTTAERYYTSAKGNRKLDERAYLFLTGSWEKDRFSGFDWRVTEALGYGYRIVATDRTTLDLEAGPGARQSREEASGKTDSEAMARIHLDLEWKPGETSTFSEEATSEIGENSTVTRSVTALKAQVSGQLAMKVSFTVQNTSSVPAGVEHTDDETAVTLVYGF
jgi:putative salt-induced outer membrane protein